MVEPSATQNPRVQKEAGKLRGRKSLSSIHLDVLGQPGLKANPTSEVIPEGVTSELSHRFVRKPNVHILKPYRVESSLRNRSVLPILLWRFPWRTAEEEITLLEHLSLLLVEVVRYYLCASRRFVCSFKYEISSENRASKSHVASFEPETLKNPG
jgi:hypothetical protein